MTEKDRECRGHVEPFFVPVMKMKPKQNNRCDLLVVFLQHPREPLRGQLGGRFYIAKVSKTSKGGRSPKRCFRWMIRRCFGPRLGVCCYLGFPCVEDDAFLSLSANRAGSHRRRHICSPRLTPPTARPDQVVLVVFSGPPRLGHRCHFYPQTRPWARIVWGLGSP